MSPRKPPTRASARRHPVHKLRSRRETATAVIGAVAVVVVSAALVWLLRPGAAGTQGSGGLANRQPRAAWLVVLVLAALVWLVPWALRRQRRWVDHRRRVLAAGVAGIGGLAVLAGFFWPGGLLRHPAPLTGSSPPSDTGVLDTGPFDTTLTIPVDPIAPTVPVDPNAPTVPGTSVPADTAPLTQPPATDAPASAVAP
ncbi:MAG: hypothetical protein ACT4OX_06795 [Actinomycetota bacterium]